MTYQLIQLITSLVIKYATLATRALSLADQFKENDTFIRSIDILSPFINRLQGSTNIVDLKKNIADFHLFLPSYLASI